MERLYQRVSDRRIEPAFREGLENDRIAVTVDRKRRITFVKPVEKADGSVRRGAPEPERGENQRNLL